MSAILNWITESIGHRCTANVYFLIVSLNSVQWFVKYLRKSTDAGKNIIASSTVAGDNKVSNLGDS